MMTLDSIQPTNCAWSIGRLQGAMLVFISVYTEHAETNYLIPLSYMGFKLIGLEFVQYIEH